MEFEQACSEMYYILEHMNPIDLKKIPQEVIKFFKENRSIFYKVNLDETKYLYEQELREETKAFIKILNAKYLAGEKEKEELNNIINKKVEIKEKNIKTEMVPYKENIFLKIIKKVLRFFKIN